MVSQLDMADLLAREREFWDAMLNKDGVTASRLTAQRCLIVGAQGVSAIDRDMMGRLTLEGSWVLKHYEFDEPSITTQALGENAVAIAYKVRELLEVDGAEITLEANDASVWTRDNGAWACALHTASPAGDPFGRDRQQQA